MDHRAVGDPGRLERLAQLGVAEDHPLESVLVIHPGQLILLHEVASFARSFAHQMPSVLGAIVQIQVLGAAHGAAPFATPWNTYTKCRRAGERLLSINSIAVRKSRLTASSPGHAVSEVRPRS